MAWLTTSSSSAIDRIVPVHIADGDGDDVYGIAQKYIYIDGISFRLEEANAVKISGPVTKAGNVSGNFANACTRVVPSGSDCPVAHASGILLTEFGVNLREVTSFNTAFTGIGTSDSDFLPSFFQSSQTCEDWTIGGEFYSFNYGSLHSREFDWHSAGSQSCNRPQRLYCIEVNK